MIKNLVVASVILLNLGPSTTSFHNESQPKTFTLSQRESAEKHDEPVKDPIVITQGSYEIEEHSSVQIGYKLEGVSPQATVSFKVEKPEVISVSPTGMVTAESVGSSLVTLVVIDGEVEYTKPVAVKVVSLTGTLNFKEKEIQLERGKSTQLEYTLSNDKLKEKRIIWTTSDTSVVSVVNGTVTAKKSGSATITASIGELESTIQVHVSVSLKDIEFNPASLSLVIDDSVALPDLIYVPFDTTTNRYATYSVENAEIASIKDGMIVAHKVGSTTVTATVNGINTPLSVTVKPKQTPSGADILKFVTVKDEEKELVLNLAPFEKGALKKYSLTVPETRIKEYLDGKNEADIILVLDDVLLERGMARLENFTVPKEVMSSLQNKKVSFHIVDGRGKPLIIYHFKNAYSNTIDLRFKVIPVTKESPLYQDINGRAYELIFENKTSFPEGTMVDVSAQLLDSTYSQMHFIYERLADSQLEYTNQEVVVNNEDRIRFNVTNNDYVITFNMISKSSDDMVIVGLLIIVLTIIGGSGLYYLKKNRKTKPQE